MNDLKIFLRISIDPPPLTLVHFMGAVGDMGLAGIRYLWDGRTAKVENSNSSIYITMIPSFNKKEDCCLVQMIKTALAIALLVPGLLLSLLKVVALCLSAEVREKHNLVKQYLTHTGKYALCNRYIGDPTHPIKTFEELQKALTVEAQKNPEDETGALVIYGDGNLTINEDPGILEFEPFKLILIGAKIIHKSGPADRLDDLMKKTGKWNLSPFRLVTLGNTDNSYAGNRSAQTLDEALNAPLTKIDDYEDYHEVYTLPQAQVTT